MRTLGTPKTGVFGQHRCPVPPQITQSAPLRLPRGHHVRRSASPARQRAAFIAIYDFLCNKTPWRGPVSPGVRIFLSPGTKVRSRGRERERLLLPPLRSRAMINRRESLGIWGFGEEGGDAGGKSPIFRGLSQQRRGRMPFGVPTPGSRFRDLTLNFPMKFVPWRLFPH